ncbi:hypothetical protein L1987_54756 [Smallanthus sonchifolius]|uniref:Uncharacterized protein n=1 Tax=Smallanthus sonchifolius TaxID=185202 RepID=A0ACB9E7M4_9ASTR|nr:hypothetical protein L1987_54756 [Smallanthus sonchifolius]
MLRFACLKNGNSLIAIGGLWEPFDGNDLSVEKSPLVQTAIRYAKDIAGLDLKNYQHWNPFMTKLLGKKVPNRLPYFVLIQISKQRTKLGLTISLYTRSYITSQKFRFDAGKNQQYSKENGLFFDSTDQLCRREWAIGDVFFMLGDSTHLRGIRVNYANGFFEDILNS